MPLSNTRFIGFDAAEERKRFKRFAVEPPGRLPAIHELRDVVAVPGLDALYDVNGNRIDITKRNYVPMDLPGTAATLARVAINDEKHCPVRIEVPSPLPVHAGTILYLGVFWAHFGHFLMDSMSRFWALDGAPPADKLLFLGNAGDAYKKHSYSLAVFEALGLNAEKLLRLDHPVLIRSVLAPEPSIQHAFRIYDNHDFAHLKVARAVLERSAGNEFDSARVYLSRSRLPPGLRRLVGEEQLEQRLRDRGFTILYPERLSLAEQIVLFNRAGHIAGSVGSAFHNALFVPKHRDVKLSILSWEKINNRYLMVDAIKGYSAAYVNCCTNREIDGRERIANTVLDVDLAVESILN